MSIEFAIASTEQHFEQILQLQQQNLMGVISPEQRANDGFVYAEHTVDLLKKMADSLPQVIALHEGKVVGYNLAMHASMKTELPSLTPMFNEFEKSHFKARLLKEFKFFVGGQVCVSKAFRGQGLLKKLYHATKNRLSPDYQLCVTEIAASNTVSLRAHQKMGFQTIHTYCDGLTQWDIVAWEL